MSVGERIREDHRKELQELTQRKELGKKRLGQLQSELWIARADLPEIQLDLEKLQREYDELEEDYVKKNKLIREMDDKRDEKLLAIQREFDVFKKDQEDKFDRQVKIIGDEYDEKAAKMLREKQEEFEKREGDYKKVGKQLRSQLEQIGTDFQDRIRLLRRQHQLRLDNEKLEVEKRTREAEDLIRRVGVETEVLNGELKEKLRGVEVGNKRFEALSGEFRELEEKAEKFENEAGSLRKNLDETRAELGEKIKEMESMKRRCEWFRKEVGRYEGCIKEEEVTRRRIHEKLQELKGNIRVFCRVKPVVMEEGVNSMKDEKSQISTNNLTGNGVSDFPSASSSLSFRCDNFASYPQHIKIIEPLDHRRKSSIGLISPRTLDFSFDMVFDQHSTNSEIFEEISQLVQSSLDGHNVCIFAYGQTGSGKTYTMSNKDDGMIPRSVKLIFERIEEVRQIGWKYEVTGQFLEIYGDNINDLMADSYLNNLDRNKAEIKHIDGKTIVTNITRIVLKSPSQVSEILLRVNGNRMTASTRMNDRSSRSHCVLIINLIGRNERTGQAVNGTLNLIDLAGSERISQSQVTGIRLRETRSINRSLSSLGDVIMSLKNRSQHVPYRNSKLTYLLQYSLGGGSSKTLMFVNVSSNVEHFNETINSLRFAEKVNGAGYIQEDPRK
ncbi:DEKNAAC101643 [Brettanomyces naardenensis]|uniref:Kinesin-like protein n=1 Tax=Brettanomyces naardenensis TaxID=13370 RepID=A0A448YIE8_BRENA|nr:DEKNAAC101643 [Brettanomyces naardenensis]